VNIVKFGLIAIFFVCIFSVQSTGAEVVWSDDLDDGDYDGWSSTPQALQRSLKTGLERIIFSLGFLFFRKTRFPIVRADL
jgi:hypothetical protein